MKYLDQLHLHCPQELPQLWGPSVLVGEPPCPLGAHWQSRCSPMQSPILHWLGPSSGLTDRETWQLPGEAVRVRQQLGAAPQVQEWGLGGRGKRACPRPLWPRSPVPASASENEAVYLVAEPCRDASFGVFPHLPHLCLCCCLHCCLPAPQETEALESASLSKAPCLSAKDLLEVSWEPRTWLEGSSLGKQGEGAALPHGPGETAPLVA